MIHAHRRHDFLSTGWSWNHGRAYTDLAYRIQMGRYDPQLWNHGFLSCYPLYNPSWSSYSTISAWGAVTPYSWNNMLESYNLSSLSEIRLPSRHELEFPTLQDSPLRPEIRENATSHPKDEDHDNPTDAAQSPSRRVINENESSSRKDRSRIAPYQLVPLRELEGIFQKMPQPEEQNPKIPEKPSPDKTVPTGKETP